MCRVNAASSAKRIHSFGIDFFAVMSQTIHRGGPVLWVNEDAERYTNENCGHFVPQCVGNAVHTQSTSYQVLSQEIVDYFMAANDYPELPADLDEAAQACPGENFYKADTIAELAEKQGLDAAALEATVARYNELCDKGEDDDYDKEAEFLIPVKTGPFYIMRQDMAFWTSIGGIDAIIARWKLLPPRAIPFLGCILPVRIVAICTVRPTPCLFPLPAMPTTVTPVVRRRKTPSRPA